MEVFVQGFQLDVPAQTLPLEVYVGALALELSEEAIAKDFFHCPMGCPCRTSSIEVSLKVLALQLSVEAIAQEPFHWNHALGQTSLEDTLEEIHTQHLKNPHGSM